MVEMPAQVWYHAGMCQPEHICGRDCDFDPDRGCPMAPEGPEPDNDPVLEAIDAELAYLASKIAYLERRDGIR